MASPWCPSAQTVEPRPAQRIATRNVNRKPNDRIARLLGMIGKGPVIASIDGIDRTRGHGFHDNRLQSPNQGTAPSRSHLLIDWLDVRSRSYSDVPAGTGGPRIWPS